MPHNSFDARRDFDNDSAMMSPPLLALLAFAAGLSVAGNYYNQALLGVLALEFQIQAGAVALVPLATQAANAVGIALLAPLGDKLARKKLLVAMMALSAGALFLAAAAPNYSALLATCVAVGLAATAAQQIVPLAVHLSPAEKRARTLGIVTGAIFTGILVARTFAGLVADAAGWRAVFAAAGAMSLATAVALHRLLPAVPPATSLPYRALIGSLWGLWRRHRDVRLATLAHGLVFAAFIGFWATLALHLQLPPFGMGASSVGLIALLGAVGALAAPFAGRATDRIGAHRVALWAAVGVAASMCVFAASAHALIGLLAGVVVLDVAVQASQVANQTRAVAIDPDARSRLNTLFMAGAIAGGAAGAAMTGFAFARFGWAGTCAVGAACSLLAVGLLRASAKSQG